MHSFLPALATVPVSLLAFSSFARAQEHNAFVGRVASVTVVSNRVPHYLSWTSPLDVWNPGVVRVDFHELLEEVPGTGGTLDMVYVYDNPCIPVASCQGWYPAIRTSRYRPDRFELGSTGNALIDACNGHAYLEVNRNSASAPGVLSTVLTALTSKAVVQPEYVLEGDKCRLTALDLLPPPSPPSFPPATEVSGPAPETDRCNWARKYDFEGAGNNCSRPPGGTPGGTPSPGSCIDEAPCMIDVAVTGCRGSMTASVRGSLTCGATPVCTPTENPSDAVCKSCGPGCGDCAGVTCDSAASCAPGLKCEQRPVGPPICAPNRDCASYGLAGFCWEPSQNAGNLPCFPL